MCVCVCVCVCVRACMCVRACVRVCVLWLLLLLLLLFLFLFISVVCFVCSLCSMISVPTHMVTCCIAGRSERAERCLADGQRGDSTIRGLTAGLVLVALLFAGAVGLTFWMYRRQHPLLCRGQLVTIVYLTVLARARTRLLPPVPSSCTLMWRFKSGVL